MKLAKKLKLPLSPTLNALSAQTLQPNGKPVDMTDFMVGHSCTVDPTQRAATATSSCTHSSGGR